MKTTDISPEACAVACMIVSNPGGGERDEGWQRRVNDVIRALRMRLNETEAALRDIATDEGEPGDDEQARQIRAQHRAIDAL